MGPVKTPEQVLNQAVADAGKHAKYLGLMIVAPFVAEKIMEFISNEATMAPSQPIRTKEWEGAGQTGVIRDWMSEINGLRLYWVWGGGLLSTVLSMLPEDFGNVTRLNKALPLLLPLRVHELDPLLRPFWY